MSSKAKIPIAIPTTRGPLAGWLHPARTAGDAALLICNAFGYEALCAHRSMKVLAEQAALAGIAALRFDYRGTGDSADARPGTDETAAWRANIVDAASWLRATTGCGRLFLAGLRLGATLARQAVEEIPGVTGLVAIEPVVSGRRYLRELGALQGSFGASIADFLESERQDQVLGFPLGPATRTSLAAIDLTQDRSTLPPRVLVLERPHMRSADKWIQALQSESCRVDRVETEEYEAMMLDPHKTQVPQRLNE
jgi:pimeloyl-ACP methyl ester carboxylesterase